VKNSSMLCVADGKLLPFSPKMFDWGRQPIEWLRAVGPFARARAGIGAAALHPKILRAIVIRRSHSDRDNGLGRYRLNSSFFTSAAAFFDAHGVSHQAGLELGTRPPAEQVRLFASASIIVGVHGAGLSNMLFTPSGALVIELGARACSNPPTDVC